MIITCKTGSQIQNELISADKTILYKNIFFLIRDQSKPRFKKEIDKQAR